MGASVPIYVQVVKKVYDVEVVYAATLAEAMIQVQERGGDEQPVKAAYSMDEL